MLCTAYKTVTTWQLPVQVDSEVVITSFPPVITQLIPRLNIQIHLPTGLVVWHSATGECLTLCLQQACTSFGWSRDDPQNVANARHRLICGQVSPKRSSSSRAMLPPHFFSGVGDEEFSAKRWTSKSAHHKPASSR